MTRLGASLLFFGIASFVLPLFGMQYTFLDGLAPETLNIARFGMTGAGLAIALLGNAMEGNAAE